MDTRQGVIAHHIRTALARAITMRCYAGHVTEHYLRSVPLHARHVPLQHTADPYADERHNAQVITRFCADDVRMPVEIEEALVLSLPEPFRTELQRELAERLGLLAAPLPAADGARDHVLTAELLRETGEFLAAIAPALEDGSLTAADLPHLRRAALELRDVQARAASIQARLAGIFAAADGSNVKPLRGAA